MHIRAQNAALIVRRLATADFVQFEVFEVLPLVDAVLEAEGKLLCSYPGPAIQVPADIFTDECFLWELSSFLAQMDIDLFDPTPTRDSSFLSDYDGAHPGYISELLVGILRGYGQPAVINRITKRIGDEVLFGAGPLWEKRPDRLRRWLLRRDRPWSDKPWRRSPLWLILRVTHQTSLRLSNLYKPLVLFFHAHLLRSCVRSDSSELKEDSRDHYHDPMTDIFRVCISFAVLLPIYLYGVPEEPERLLCPFSDARCNRIIWTSTLHRTIAST